MLRARVRPRLDPPDAVLRLRRYLHQHARLPYSVGHHAHYRARDGWQLVAVQAVRDVVDSLYDLLVIWGLRKRVLQELYITWDSDRDQRHTLYGAFWMTIAALALALAPRTITGRHDLSSV